MALTQAQKDKAAKEKAVAAKTAKFQELASARTTRAINCIRSISKLSNRNSYVYTDEQAVKICNALKAEVNDLHEHFSRKPGQKAEGFTV